MKKLLKKDKKIRKKIKKLEKKKFILRLIVSNSNLTNLLRFNAFYNLNKLPKKASKTLISNRCVTTVNKKKINSLTNFSRIIFRNLVRNNDIHGVNKSSW